MTVIKTGQVIVLERPGEKSERVRLGSELKSGGAGSVYSIKDDLLRVIKIYNDETLRKEGKAYQEKIECMLGNVPKVAETALGDKDFVQLAWPLASAYTIHGKFVGFAMPMVDMQQTAELEFILSHKQAEKEGLPHHLGVGLRLAHNLAAVVSSIHVLGHAIVDLKPVNLKFFKKELYVAVLDCDGFYINVPGNTASAPQVTPDYLAPEFHNAPITTPEHQDRFALAVIIFQLLNFGIHPYSCVPKNNAQIPPDTERKIKSNLYPYGLIPHKRVSPKPGSAHEAIPVELRTLFDHAFGDSPSSRPTAFEWAESLRKFALASSGLLARCDNQHIHFKGMLCATCLREQVISNASSANKSLRQQGITHTIATPSPVPRTVSVQSSVQQANLNRLSSWLANRQYANIQSSTRQSQTHPSSAQPSVSKVGVKPSFFQKISRIPKKEMFFIALFLLSIGGFIAGSGWVFWPSTIIFFLLLTNSSGEEIGVRAVVATIFAAIWFGILDGIQYVVQHYWEFILIFVTASFIASSLIYFILGKLTSPAKPRIGKSAFGGLALSALLFGGLWAWWPAVLEKAIARFDDRQPVLVADQQADEKQKSPQDAIPKPDTVPATISWTEFSPRTPDRETAALSDSNSAAAVASPTFADKAHDGEMTAYPMIPATREVVSDTSSATAGWADARKPEPESVAKAAAEEANAKTAASGQVSVNKEVAASKADLNEPGGIDQVYLRDYGGLYALDCAQPDILSANLKKNSIEVYAKGQSILVKNIESQVSFLGRAGRELPKNFEIAIVGDIGSNIGANLIIYNNKKELYVYAELSGHRSFEERLFGGANKRIGHCGNDGKSQNGSAAQSLSALPDNFHGHWAENCKSALASIKERDVLEGYRITAHEIDQHEIGCRVRKIAQSQSVSGKSKLVVNLGCEQEGESYKQNVSLELTSEGKLYVSYPEAKSSKPEVLSRCSE